MTIISPRGLEVSNVALMGFRNSGPYAQRFMDQRLRPYEDFVNAYIDDVVIYSYTAKQHEQHLRKVFKLFEEIGLALNPKKSFLGYPSVKLLGFTVDGSRIAIPESRVEAIKKIKMPTNLAAARPYFLPSLPPITTGGIYRSTCLILTNNNMRPRTKTKSRSPAATTARILTSLPTGSISSFKRL